MCGKLNRDDDSTNECFAHFIRLLACSIASYHSLTPLALNSVCSFDSVCACVCVSDNDVYCFVEPLQFNRRCGMLRALMLRQHEVMTQ